MTTIVVVVSQTSQGKRKNNTAPTIPQSIHSFQKPAIVNYKRYTMYISNSRSSFQDKYCEIQVHTHQLHTQGAFGFASLQKVYGHHQRMQARKCACSPFASTVKITNSISCDLGPVAIHAWEAIEAIYILQRAKFNSMSGITDDMVCKPSLLKEWCGGNFTGSSSPFLCLLACPLYNGLSTPLYISRNGL